MLYTKTSVTLMGLVIFVLSC